jgi:hypothetical protein
VTSGCCHINCISYPIFVLLPQSKGVFSVGVIFVYSAPLRHMSCFFGKFKMVAFCSVGAPTLPALTSVDFAFPNVRRFFLARGGSSDLSQEGLYSIVLARGRSKCFSFSLSSAAMRRTDIFL